MGKESARKKILKRSKHPRVAVDGFLYHFHKKCTRHLRWKCNRVFSIKCPSIMKTTTDMNDLKIVGFDHDHIHSDDSKMIDTIENRVANKTVKFRGSLTKQTTVLKLNISDVFDHQNGKRLHPYTNESTSNSTIHEHSINTNTNTNENSNIEESKRLNPQNNSINLTGQNETEIHGVVVEQNMHRSTSHTDIEMHSPTHQKINSNQIIEISDDDDNYEYECNGVQFDIATSSGKKLSNMIEKKNPLVDIENYNQTKLMYPCQKNVPTSMASTSSDKSIILQSIESVLEKQQTPYTRQSSSENVNSNETIPQCSSTCSKKEVEVAKIRSSKGVVSIYIVDGSIPTSTSSNSFNGSRLNETCSKPLQTTSVPSKLPLKKKDGLNNSFTTVTPIQIKNELSDVVQETCIDLTDDDNEVGGVDIKNTFSKLQPVPESIPLSEYVQDNLQQVPETNKIVTSNTVPIPNIKVTVPSN